MTKKDLTYLLIIFGLGFTLWFFTKANDTLYKDLIGKSEAYNQLSKTFASLKIDYVAQERLNEVLKSEFEELTKTNVRLNGEVKMLSNATFLIKEKARKSNSPDLSYQSEEGGFIVIEVGYEKGPAVGYVAILDDGTVVSKMFNQEIKTTQVVTRDETSGRYSVIAKSHLTIKTPTITNRDWLNKPYPLNIVDGVAYIDPTLNVTKNRMFWLNPSFNAVIGYDKELVPGLSLSLMSYGRTKVDSKYKFATIAYTKNNLLTVTPVLYRPFELLPNTYLGLGVEANSSMTPFFSVQIGL